jgi:hypothetical protein
VFDCGPVEVEGANSGGGGAMTITLYGREFGSPDASAQRLKGYVGAY